MAKSKRCTFMSEATASKIEQQLQPYATPQRQHPQRNQFPFRLNGVSVDAQYETKKMDSVGKRIMRPNAKGGVITTSGKDAISPIRMSEVGWLFPEFPVPPRIRSGIPTNSLKKNTKMIGSIEAISASSVT
jgi:hypothetical protein